jgi:hypothetical protein
MLLKLLGTIFDILIVSDMQDKEGGECILVSILLLLYERNATLNTKLSLSLFHHVHSSERRLANVFVSLQPNPSKCKEENMSVQRGDYCSKSLSKLMLLHHWNQHHDGFMKVVEHEKK